MKRSITVVLIVSLIVVGMPTAICIGAQAPYPLVTGYAAWLRLFDTEIPLFEGRSQTYHISHAPGEEVDVTITNRGIVYGDYVWLQIVSQATGHDPIPQDLILDELGSIDVQTQYGIYHLGAVWDLYHQYVRIFYWDFPEYRGE